MGEKEEGEKKKILLTPLMEEEGEKREEERKKEEGKEMKITRKKVLFNASDRAGRGRRERFGGRWRRRR